MKIEIKETRLESLKWVFANTKFILFAVGFGCGSVWTLIILMLV